MPDWTLQHAAETKTFAAWGLERCACSMPSLSTGTFTGVIKGPLTATVPWAFKDTVIIRLGDDVKFRGTAMPVLRSGAGPEEQVISRFVDPWWWLGQDSYTQAVWDTATEAAVQAASVALFAAITPGTGWAPQSIGAEIAAIIAHCDALHGGGRMQLGTLSGDGFNICPTPQRLDANATHEAALRRCLGWVPDAIPQWDHSTSPPTLNIAQRSAATVRTYSFADGHVMVNQQITKREDRAVTGVRLVYVGLDAFGNPTTVVDQAGATSGSGVVNATIDLTGGAAAAGGGVTTLPEVNQKYTVESETIAPLSAEWWFKHGDTGAASAAEISVGTSSAQISGLSRHFLRGMMPATIAEDHLVEGRVLGYLTITKAVDFDGGSGAGGATVVSIEKRYVNVILTTTDREGEYTHNVKPAVTPSPASGDGMTTFAPTGIAAALLAAWSDVQHDGAFSITDDECDEASLPGDVVNLNGGLSAWETMKAHVRQVDWDIDNATTSVSLGVAEHLSVQEFMTLIKVMRIAPALDLDRLSAGTVSGDADPTDMPVMVTPQSVLTTAFITKQAWSYVKGGFKTEHDGELAKTVHSKTDGTAKTTIEPASVKVENPVSESTTESTPDAITQSKSGNTSELKADGLTFTKADGSEIVINAEGITITKDGNTTTLSLLELLHSAAGVTNSITQSQMVITDGGKVGTFQGNSVVVSDGGDSAELSTTNGVQLAIGGNAAELDTAHMQITRGSDSVEASPEVGLRANNGSNSAQISPDGGVELDANGGTIDIVPASGAEESMLATDFCEGGETLSARVLRGAPA